MKIEKDINTENEKMISYCKKYVDGIEKIYLYCSYENEVSFSDFFMKYKGKIVEKNEVDKLLKLNLQDSIKKQKEFSSTLMEMFTNILKFAKSKNADLPTEIKTIFDCKSNSFKFVYSYDEKYSSSNKIATDIFDEWKKSIKA